MPNATCGRRGSTCQVIPEMRARGQGWILNLTSFSAELPPGPLFALKAKDGSAIYGATKPALNRLTLRRRERRRGSLRSTP